jgi:hypothetical protein
MKYFRNKLNTVCAFESNGSQDYLITADMVAMTDAEVELHIHPVIVLSTVDQLANLDAENPISQRSLRDFIMMTTNALKLGQPVDLSATPAVKKAISIEAQAAALRAKL